MLFKELFYIAAKDLADVVQEPLEDIGVLFGSIMNTGTISKSDKVKLRHGLSLRRDDLDSAEKGKSHVYFGRGQLLFLVRRADRSESLRLQSAGFRFATISNIIELLARSMEVTKEELLPQLEQMQGQCEQEHLLEPGVYLSCFALRPLIRRGFDILVPKDAHNMLPTSRLLGSKLEQWQVDILHRMDNWDIATCLEKLQGGTLFDDHREQQFARQLFKSITELAGKINSPFFQDARLVAAPLKVPCKLSRGSQSLQQAYMIAFRIITDAHLSSPLNDRYEFASLKFFLCQQHAYQDSPDNVIFGRKINKEFAAFAEGGEYHSPTSLSSPRRSYFPGSDIHLGITRDRSASPPRNKKWPARKRSGGSCIADDNSSEKNLVHTFGPIHVANEIDIDVSEMTRDSQSPDVEMSTLGSCTEAGARDIEGESFADNLAALTTNERRRQRTI